MSMTVLIRGHRSSLSVLADACFTKANYNTPASHPNTTLGVNTPRGVLGGSVAGVSSAAGDYTAVPCTALLQPIGLFLNDAAGAAFENSPAVASGKVAVMKGMASVEVDVYETHDVSNAAQTYAVGDLLYSSANGFLTKEQEDPAAVVVGVCTKAPTVSSPTLGLEMRI